MTDDLFIKTFILKTKSGKLKTNFTKTNIERNLDIYKSLENRFKNSDSIQENLFRVINKIENRPVCPICGKRLKFSGSAISGGYHSTCGSKKCRQINYENKLEERTGCRNSFQLQKTKDRVKQTLLERYGVDNPAKSKEIQEKITKTCIEKYGHRFKLQFETNPFTWPEVKEKCKQTCLEKYGVENIRQSKFYKENIINPFLNKEIQEKCKQTCLEKYGVEYYSQTLKWKALWKDPEFLKNKLEKEYKTKKERHSYGPNSKEEAYIFNKLKEKWPNTDNQYYNKTLYPFKCDFYIPEIDTWIEYQGYYTHGNHPYNENSEEDKKLLKLWFDKGYELAIKTWTCTDPLKRLTAKQNSLKYLEFFTIKDFEEWFSGQ